MPLNIQFPSAGRALMQAEQIKGARSQNTLRDLQVQDYEEDRGFLKKQREFQGKQQARTEEQWKFQDETQALDYLMKEAPLINFENYPESRDYLIGKGLNPAILPEPQEMLDQAMQAGVMPAQYFESWKNQALVSLKDRTAAFKAQTGRIAAEAKGQLVTLSKKNKDGTVRTIKKVVPGSDQETKLIDQGFVRGTQTIGIKPSVAERKETRLRGAVDKLSEEAMLDPNAFHEKHNFRQNDDGTLYIDPVSNAPIRLEPHYKALGKRTNMKAIKGLGEQWDDVNELNELLELPSVKKNLAAARESGFWDRVAGRWSNQINKWMQDNGIAKDSPTATAIARIQRMTSEERKTFMGVAVTELELRSALAWMPNSGDSYDMIVNKTRLMGQEAEQEFRRWLAIFEDTADMSPFYKAFGVKRFTDETPTSTEGETPENIAPEEAIEHLRKNPHLKNQFKEMYGYVPEGL